MPSGFSGRAATVYLNGVTQAHTRAATTGARLVDRAPSQIKMLPTRLPFTADDSTPRMMALTSTGHGNSGNVVVDQNEYEALTRRISQTDDKMGQCLFNIANEIEMLCRTAFALPSATPRCMNISNTVKRTLGEFRSLTEDMVMQTRRFAREIVNIR